MASITHSRPTSTNVSIPRPWRWLRTPWAWPKVSILIDRRALKLLPLIGISILAILVVAVSVGEYPISIPDVLRSLFKLGAVNANVDLVIHTLRLPRALTALLVGAALATSGVILQGLTRNELADPGILGINAGAGVLVVWIVISMAAVTANQLAWIAFGGGLAAAGLVYALSWKRGSSTLRLILVGVGVNAAAGGITNGIILKGDIHQAQAALSWLTGSVYGSTYDQVRVMLIGLAMLLPLGWAMARHLNAMQFPDDVSRGLGIRLGLQRGLLIALAAALSALTVSVAGNVGFVGLVAPHLARRLVGPAHQGLLPAAAGIGAALVGVADLVSRTVIAPNEVPLGVATAIIGAPYFAYLLYRKGR